MFYSSEKLKEIATSLITEETGQIGYNWHEPQFSRSGGFFSFYSDIMPNGYGFVFDGNMPIETNVRFTWYFKLDWEGNLIGEIEFEREQLLSPDVAPKESIKAPDGWTFQPIDNLGAWGDGNTVEDSDITFDCWRHVVEAYA